MNSPTRSRDILRTSILVFASLSISLPAWGQHRESRGQGEHAGNPGHSGGQDHGSAPSHASGPSHSSALSHENSRGRREATGTQPGRTASAPDDRSGNAGNRGSNAPNNRGGNASADRSGNAAGNHGRNNSGNQGGNAADNRGGNPSKHPGNRSGNAGNWGRNPSSDRGGYNAGNRGSMNNRRVPARTVSLRGGGSASFRPNGQVRVIHRDGMRIQHNLRGGRTIVTERRDVRIVTRGGGGYVQRTYVTRGGRSFYSRTYYNHGVYRVGVYRGYYYHRRHYYGYYPAYWYHPVFYSWAYRPWGPPVYWGVGIGGWGWGPWYGYYGGYFAPYSVYPSAAFWLTDYVIAANLQAAYESRAEANAEAAGYDRGYRDGASQAASNGQVTLTPEVKQAIAEEVKAQLAEEQQQSSGGQGGSYDGRAQAFEPADGEVPPALDPARRTFVVASDLTVVSNGQECDLTAGDVITRLTDTPDTDQRVNVSVQASKKGDCGAGQQVAVSVDDLQDMRNHFQEQLDSGMKDLAEKQGKGGLPRAPDTGTTASDVPPPSPDTDAEQELTQQEKAADQAESQVEQENAAGPDQDQ